MFFFRDSPRLSLSFPLLLGVIVSLHAVQAGLLGMGRTSGSAVLVETGRADLPEEQHGEDGSSQKTDPASGTGSNSEGTGESEAGGETGKTEDEGTATDYLLGGFTPQLGDHGAGSCSRLYREALRAHLGQLTAKKLQRSRRAGTRNLTSSSKLERCLIQPPHAPRAPPGE